MKSHWLYRRRWLLLAAVCATLVTALVAIPHFLTVACWAGSKELHVCVDIADADTMKPLAGVPIAVFNGPWTPLEGPGVAPDPHSASADIQEFVTDENGHAECSRRFFAYGRDGAFEHSGCIRLAGTWIQVAPPGYNVVLLPLDGQSEHPRNLEGSPVFVTLLLRKSTGSLRSDGRQEHAH